MTDPITPPGGIGPIVVLFEKTIAIANNFDLDLEYKQIPFTVVSRDVMSVSSFAINVGASGSWQLKRLQLQTNGSGGVTFKLYKLDAGTVPPTTPPVTTTALVSVGELTPTPIVFPAGNSGIEVTLPAVNTPIIFGEFALVSGSNVLCAYAKKQATEAGLVRISVYIEVNDSGVPL